MDRKEKVNRKTRETDIELELNIDGTGNSDIQTPVPFLSHMLESFTRHGNFDLKIRAMGDVEVDPHHLIEDIGICLGLAIAGCTRNKRGINRFGFMMLPMDEAEVSVSLDLGGRAYLRYNVETANEKIEKMDIALVEDFFRSLVANSSINLHINKIVGINPHHIVEAVFKAFGIALHNSTRLAGNSAIPSTKGLL